MLNTAYSHQLHVVELAIPSLPRLAKALCDGPPWSGRRGTPRRSRVCPTTMRRPILRNQQEQARPTSTPTPRDYYSSPSPRPERPATASSSSSSPSAPAPRLAASASARASYPVFLSFHDTLKLQIGWAWRGLVDAFRWDVVVSLMTRHVVLVLALPTRLPFFSELFFVSDAEVRANALKSFLLNGISLLSLYAFDLLVRALASGGEGRDSDGLRVGRSVGWFYRVLWMLPVVGVSLYLNVRTVVVVTVYIVSTDSLLTFFLLGLVVFSRCQAHLYAALRSCVPVCRRDDDDDVAEQVHRVPQLARYVCVSRRHDRDVRLCLVCAGPCPRRRRCV